MLSAALCNRNEYIDIMFPSLYQIADSIYATKKKKAENNIQTNVYRKLTWILVGTE